MLTAVCQTASGILMSTGHSMYPTVAQAKRVSLGGVSWLHTAIYEPEAAALLIERCRAAHVPFSIDLEPVTFRDGIDTLARHIAGAETVFCNSRAADRLGGDPVKTLEALGAKSVVLTQGPAGASWCGQGKVLSVSAPKVDIEDTTGAGDCLAGWFVAETLRGAGPRDALRMAVAAATWSCTRLGAQASFPRRTDIAGSIPS